MKKTTICNNIGKFKSLVDFHNAFPDEKSCIAYLEHQLWPNGEPVSPFDPTSKVYRRGDGMYRCKNTGKNFNVRIGTMFEGSKTSLYQWFMAIFLVTSHKKGISSIQLAKDLGVTQKTAWFMLQRIRENFGIESKDKFDGEVELDETFVGGKNKNRHKNKKVKNSQGRSFKDKTPVMGILQRGGCVVCKVIDNTTYKQLTGPVLRKVKLSATVYSDEWQGYKLINKVYKKHHVVDHGHGIYVNGGAYTNTIEAFWSNYCKRSINGTYSWISRKHMQRYFDEFSFRYNTNDMDESERFHYFTANCKRRITYSEVISQPKKAAI